MRSKTKKEKEFIKLLSKRIRTLQKALRFFNTDFIAFKYEIDRLQFGKYERALDMAFCSLLRLSEAFNISLQEFFAEGFDSSIFINKDSDYFKGKPN